MEQTGAMEEMARTEPTVTPAPPATLDTTGYQVPRDTSEALARTVSLDPLARPEWILQAPQVPRGIPPKTEPMERREKPARRDPQDTRERPGRMELLCGREPREAPVRMERRGRRELLEPTVLLAIEALRGLMGLQELKEPKATKETEETKGTREIREIKEAKEIKEAPATQGL